jgi:O-succinylbenzoate synthase
MNQLLRAGRPFVRVQRPSNIRVLFFKEVAKMQIYSVAFYVETEGLWDSKLRDPQILSAQAKELRKIIIKTERKLRFFR